MMRALVLVLAATILSAPAAAHEVRPAYLEIVETAAADYDLLWKTPMLGAATIRLEVVLPEGCRDSAPRVDIADGTARVVLWSAHCENGLAGREIRIDGLDGTMVETIVRFERADGATQTARLMRGETAFVAAEPSTPWGVAGVYLPLGIEHILFGFDHLCFVLALLLLVGSLRRLFWAITAFTVAHSLTLAAATLGYVSAPAAPIEALIAFSIALVAAEAVAARRGQSSPTVRRPWIVAFAFGLLHGFGFAGALSATGLPADAIPLSLLFFNLGVEIGQIAFVLAILVLAAGLRRLPFVWPRWCATAPAFAIGILAAFWTIERVAGIVG